jgi:hypothetical protein
VNALDVPIRVHLTAEALAWDADVGTGGSVAGGSSSSSSNSSSANNCGTPEPPPAFPASITVPAHGCTESAFLCTPADDNSLPLSLSLGDCGVLSAVVRLQCNGAHAVLALPVPTRMASGPHGTANPNSAFIEPFGVPVTIACVSSATDNSPPQLVVTVAPRFLLHNATV